MGINTTNEKPTIEVKDVIRSRANKEARQLILPLLHYRAKHYQRGLYRGETVFKDHHLISGRTGTGGYLYTGFLKRIKREFQDKIDFLGKIEKIKPKNKTPYLRGITFREDQLRAIKKMRIAQRGVILYPTGAGKTIICFGFLSMFLEYRILFLCHTIDLINQASEELKKFKIRHNILGGGRKINSSFWNKESCLLLSTVQSFSKIEPEIFSSFFDITIVDEVHNAGNSNIRYSNLMEVNLSPIRIGLTATLPTDRHKSLMIEGLFGPVISELTNEEGNKIGIIAKAIVDLIPVRSPDSLINERDYQKIYQKGIVENKFRNKTIIDVSLKSIQNNEQVLIIVDKIKHGDILRDLFKEHKINCPFVQGVEKSEYRFKIKRRLKEKKLMVAIATRVWKEGINIPTLNHIIFAAGGKDDKSIRQAMGRGLRVTDGKSEIKLTDFMDNGKYLAEHSVSRFAVYKKLKWI